MSSLCVSSVICVGSSGQSSVGEWNEESVGGQCVGVCVLLFCVRDCMFVCGRVCVCVSTLSPTLSHI